MTRRVCLLATGAMAAFDCARSAHSSGSPLATFCASRESSPLNASGWQEQGAAPPPDPQGEAGLRTSIRQPAAAQPGGVLSAGCGALSGTTAGEVEQYAANVPRFLASARVAHQTLLH